MAKGFKTGGGSRKGKPNRINLEFRETVRRLLEQNTENFQRWLTTVAEGDGTENGKPDPGKALDIIAKLAEFAAPKLGRIEHAGEMTVRRQAEELTDDELARIAAESGNGAAAPPSSTH